MELARLLDFNLFLAINHLPHTVWTDWVAQLLSGFESGWIIWAIIGVGIFIAEERKNHTFWFPMGIAGALSFLFAEVVFKYSVARIRPAFLSEAILIGSLPHSYSFPSTHATVAFAFAYLFSVKKPVLKGWLYVLAVLVCFSRVYLGHHYPLDVVGGGILGTAIGLFSVYFEHAVYVNSAHDVTGNTAHRKRKRLTRNAARRKSEEG